MTIRDCQRKSHGNAVAKGFWESSQNISEKLMLIVTELAEACEALRKGEMGDAIDIGLAAEEMANGGEDFSHFIAFVKNTFPDELADVIIRTCDLAEFMGYDLETHVLLKMRYNETRPRLHGKAF